MSSPLRAVMGALESGAHSRADVSRITGLRPDVVDAAIDHLLRMGRLTASELSTGCPSAGCGSCPSGTEGTGCGTAPASPDRGRPVLVQLSVCVPRR